VAETIHSRCGDFTMVARNVSGIPFIANRELKAHVDLAVTIHAFDRRSTREGRSEHCRELCRHQRATDRISPWAPPTHSLAGGAGAQ